MGSHHHGMNLSLPVLRQKLDHREQRLSICFQLATSPMKLCDVSIAMVSQTFTIFLGEKLF